MSRLLKSVRAHIGLTAAAVLVIAGTGVAAVTWTQGVAATVETSPGAATFNRTLFINLFAASNPPITQTGSTWGVAGFGDVIRSVDVGRDDRGPYCAIQWTPGPGSPHVPGAITHPCYPQSLMDMSSQWPIPLLPPQWDGPGGEGGGGPEIDCSLSTPFTLVYRPTNDPLNPGWTSLPGSAGQLEDGLAACHAVAEEIRRHIDSVTGVAPLAGSRFPAPAGGIAGSSTGGLLPMIVIETEYSQSAEQSSPYYLEFYKFRIQTL